MNLAAQLMPERHEFDVDQVLQRGLQPYRVALDGPAIERLRQAFERWPGRSAGDEGEELVFFLLDELQRCRDQEAGLQNAFDAFTRAHGATPLARERQRLILEFATQLGRDRVGLRGDRRAFDRYFGADAVTDRYRNRRAETERRMTLVLDRLGHAVEALLESLAPMEAAADAAWDRMRLEAALVPLLAHEGDDRVQQATFACLARAIRGLPTRERESALEGNTLRFVYRSALESRLSVWIQAEAMDLLGEMSQRSFVRAASMHFEQQRDGDAFFVRSRIVPLVLQHVTEPAECIALLRRAAQDASPSVRQAVATVLHQLPRDAACELLDVLVEDAEPCVRARALGKLAVLVEPERCEHFGDILALRAIEDEDERVVRVALEQIPDVYAAIANRRAGVVWLEGMTDLCRDLHAHAESTRVRRWAAQTGEVLWLASDDRASELYESLAEALEDLAPGARRALPRELVEDVSLTDLGRVLALLALTDHGFDVEFTRRHLHIVRGHRFGLRAWRLLHEFRKPATDKRQGFRHTIGRHFDGTLQVPSTVLCELAATKVPGEPRHIEEEDGWRPFLPLLDNLLSALDRGSPLEPVHIVTTEGVTELRPPRGMFARLRARWFLTRNFEQLAEKRNWQAGDNAGASEDYVGALRSLGFRIAFRPHDWQVGLGAEDGDERVRRFLPNVHAALGLPLLPELAGRAQEYFYSIYQNTLTHLSTFLLGASALLLGQHLTANLRIRAARRAIALVIGGWGTRGKSGTERLKAALFNGLGYTLVSKTTGCEAMFIFARSFGEAREMFLFRPYDKATIWEQANLLSVAKGLGAEVFLWECMALNPSFVDILQRQWMRDDYATITNAYPDHEDIQGPSGVDIPQVIARFIPRRSTVITSEEYMLPILRSEARRVATDMVEVGWREALELPPDILDRFPYEEHPYNVALVATMARALGIDADFALKEMADRVIPDLGVLKTFPEAEVAGRRLQFTNGMSANERFGCLGNWRRMEFDRTGLEDAPHEWISTVVNNRADRVARSKVFASILVNDLSADRHVLIGTNLDGLRSYVEEAWNEAFADFELADGSDPVARTRTVRGWLTRFRIPADEIDLAARVRAMAEGIGVPCDDPLDGDALIARVRELRPAVVEDVAAWLQGFGRQHEEAAALLALARSEDTTPEDLTQALLAQLHSWFEEKLVVVEDADASGEAVLDEIVHATPPGLLNRIMGVQNIKGTGLDFVYRWLAWEAVHRACAQVTSEDPRETNTGLQTLVNFHEYGQLSEAAVRALIAHAGEEPALQKEATRAQLAAIEATLDSALAADAERGDAQAAGGWVGRMRAQLEQVLDSFDAVLRRRRADRLYQDLIDERVSPERAALELQHINRRQKGGWLRSAAR